MRVLHTSDWHLGRSFHRESLLGAQAAFVDHLIETVVSERVDVVVVAGDVYDRALPPVDAVALCNEALRRLTDARVRTVLISGNHDSAQRLGFGADLIDAAGVHLRTSPAQVGAPVLVGDLAVYPIPYLEPDLVKGPWELERRGHAQALGHAMDLIRRDLARRRPAKSLVLAHAFVTGGQGSESERDISVGGVAHVPMSVFDSVDYVALGHLHGRQRMSDRVRYSGSPIAYSFSEIGQRKGSWLVDLDGTEPAAEFADAPVPRPIGRLTGRLDDLLTGPEHAAWENHWLQVTLTDPVRPKAAMDRLKTRFPHTLALSFAPEGGREGTGSWTERLKGRSDVEVAMDFVREVRGEEADAEEAKLIREAFEASRIRGAGV
ncbi:exonuclease SbcCD subunit D [Rhizohabitans arisaemae]|uniref:exonuclease SbcCD subunit D n=1 Tax=Rhizohabitans arisaemae TaxID=2720610 RepID=UPI0024B1D844|nr:exonuclease SbcCD subunit D [Rhizohabitans arisaemae]